MEGIGEEEAHIDAGEYLPEHLLHNILARLPVKSLIRFTCVCKSWLRLIRSHEFAHYHYATCCNLPDNAFHYLLAVNRLWHVDSTLFYFISDNRLQIDVNDPFSPPISELKLFSRPENIENSTYSADIIGPCNGIFCLVLRVDWTQVNKWFPSILLWNPSTREARALKGCPLKFHRLGFGFDSSTCDYKVVCTHHRHSKNKSHIVEVYSLNSDSWRTLDVSYFFDGSWDFSLSIFSDSSNGRMFNWASEYGKLITFDMTDEVFIRTSFPGEYSEYQFTRHPSNDSQVNIICSHLSSMFKYDFWVLDSDYGPGATWTMLRTVTVPESSGLLGFWKERLLLSNGTLVSYDPTSKHFSFTRFLGGYVGVGYTPSLVSLKSRGVEEYERMRQLNGVQNYDQIQYLSLGKVDEQEHENLLKFPIEIRNPSSYEYFTPGVGDPDEDQ